MMCMCMYMYMYMCMCKCMCMCMDMDMDMDKYMGMDMGMDMCMYMCIGLFMCYVCMAGTDASTSSLAPCELEPAATLARGSPAAGSAVVGGMWLSSALVEVMVADRGCL